MAGTGAVALSILAAGAIAATPVPAQMIYTEFPEPGETFVNSCEALPLHAAPDAYSPVVETATFGDRFTVQRLAGKYLLPKSTRYSETHDYDFEKNASGEDEFDKRDFFYAWLEVRVGARTAFASTRCMLSPDYHAKQNYEDAERKFEQAAMAGGGKGFNLKPASGGAGKGLAGQLASASSDAEAMNALLERTSTNPSEKYEAFRREGELGEFAQQPGDEKLRTRPARDVEVRRQGDPDFGEALDNVFD